MSLIMQQRVPGQTYAQRLAGLRTLVTDAAEYVASRLLETATLPVVMECSCEGMTARASVIHIDFDELQGNAPPAGNARDEETMRSLSELVLEEKTQLLDKIRNELSHGIYSWNVHKLILDGIVTVSLSARVH